MNVLLIIGIYLTGINLLGFITMRIDKQRAKRQAWRIPEATLFSLALFGGSIGCLAGMYAFRHKTQKISFFIGMPAILILQILITLVLLFFSPIYFRVM
ncbi:MAG: DUF1294 domain-containing protein [Lachnospiraceae bacterium]